MKLFISWSGPESKGLAKALREWITEGIQEIESFISEDDVSKGSLWHSEISERLSGTDEGVVCVTRSNLNSPWLNFEAGAISKHTGNSSVRPLLLDLENSDVTGPLTNFQMTNAKDKDDMLKFMQSMNEACERPLPDSVLKRIFERSWEDFLAKIREIETRYRVQERPTPRSSEEIAAETLERVRQLQREMTENSESLNILLRRELRRAERAKAARAKNNQETLQGIELPKSPPERERLLESAYSSIFDDLEGESVTLRDGTKGTVFGRQSTDSVLIETKDGEFKTVSVGELLTMPELKRRLTRLTIERNRRSSK